MAEQLIKLAKVLADIATDITADVAADIATDIIGRIKLKIQQLKELEAFNSLRLPVEDAAEAATKILAEVLVKLASETELARMELVQTELVRTELMRIELVRTELV